MELRAFLRNSGPQLFVLSFISLFLELLIIRWMASELVFFTIFKTFPLVACFVGLGVGMSLKGDSVFKWFPLSVVLFVSSLKLAELMDLSNRAFPTATVYQWLDYNFWVSNQFWVYVLLNLLALFIFLCCVFNIMVCLGSRIGILFNNLKPLSAYCINISGAVAGSVSFALCSFLCFQPWALLLPAIAVSLYYSRRRCIAAVIMLLLACTAAWLPVKSSPDRTVMWSPYYRLELFSFREHPESASAEAPAGIGLSVGHWFMQYFFPNLSATTSNQGMNELLMVRQRYYQLPYSFKPAPQTVLVLGAGTGQDVLEAVRHNARSIDAVEIDPVIINLGRKFNPAYSSPKVHLIADDARNYLNRCHKKYDLIVFGCLDSLGMVGLGSSVRTDVYTHTQDCFSKILTLLKPDGILVVSFGAAAHNTWLPNRLFATLQSAAGYAPLALTDEHAKHSWPALVFVSGPPVVQGLVHFTAQPDGYRQIEIDSSAKPHILTDDWPYLYLSPQQVDVPYLLVMFEVLGLAIFASRRVLFRPAPAASWQMFFLGAAFLLLELQSIARLSLLYGATWVTSAIVINGVLLMILAANFIVIKFSAQISQHQKLAYAGLLGSLLVSYLLPVGDVLKLDAQATFCGHLLVTVLTLLPMMIAGMIFANAFSQTPDAASALSFNILGSVLGAMLEYLSNYFGINSLVLVAAVLYTASLAFYLQSGKTGAIDSATSAVAG